APEGDDPVLIVKTAPTTAVEPEDPQSAAARILDDAVPAAEREALIVKFLHEAPALIRAMVVDLKPGTPEEYRRIPWIWRVAIAAGKQNEAKILKQILDVSLPLEKAPLRDWEAVVIGGGLINGVSQLDKWPAERFDEVLKESPELQARWKRTLELSAEMADSSAVPSGTRYDALRMVALRGWKQSGEQLTRYLRTGTNDELQMGAVSGSVDVDSLDAVEQLLAAMPIFSKHNRSLAIDGLLRGPVRTAALVSALEEGTAKVEWLNESQRNRLLSLRDANLKKRAETLLKQK
ncbi:MAG: hypothetical protein NT069_28140, partial [Planctomycetota bacterium]|nr:hypothetical protein [Planctomycetota bacterium]